MSNINTVRRPKILIVAMANSVHVARWIQDLGKKNWEIHLFPSIDTGSLHQDITKVHVHNSVYAGLPKSGGKQNVHDHGLVVPFNGPANAIRGVLSNIFPAYRAWQLALLIVTLHPDIVHSMEFQHAGYLTLDVRRLLTKFKIKFPTWIVTNFGSDVYLFSRLKEHKNKIAQILLLCDYYKTESIRDVGVAQELGLKAKVLPIFPNAGGFDIKSISKFRRDICPSERKIILLKGYQGWAGRAFVGLRALELCKNFLTGYKVVIYSASAGTPVDIAAELFSQSTGIAVTIIPPLAPHVDILRLHGEARIYLGLSISDGISTSLLEAMTMGAFPIQSNTSTADEWIKQGKTGFIVPPEDPEIIAQYLKKALTNDRLVNVAAEENFKVIKEKLDRKNIQKQVVEIYSKILQEKVL